MNDANEVGVFISEVSRQGATRMKAYVMTTGTVFGLITLAHVLRIIAEGPHLLTEPVWILLTIAAAGMAVWAWRLLWNSAPT